MTENYVTGKTKLDGILQKKEDLMKEAAEVVKNIFISRCDEGKTISYEDIKNLLNGFSDSEKFYITAVAMCNIHRNVDDIMVSHKKKVNKNSRYGIFG